MGALGGCSKEASDSFEKGREAGRENETAKENKSGDVVIGGGKETVEENKTEEKEVSGKDETVEKNAGENVVTSEDKIRSLVEKELEGKNNLKKEYKRKVEISEQGGGYTVAVDFNASDNLSSKMRKTGMEGKMSEIYISLFTSDENIASVEISAYFPLVDKYGNESEGLVYQSELTKEEAGKVNWQTDGPTPRLRVLPAIWETEFIHPAFL